MKREDFLTLAGAAAVAPAVPGVPDATLALAGGATYFPSFASAPFPHESRAAGHDYQGKHYAFAGHYDDGTAALFVPHDFRAGAQGCDVIVHFHGWNNDVRTVLTRYRLREQVLASARNAVLVVPQGPKDAPDSGDGKLELERDGFRRFLEDVVRWLRARRIVASERIGRVVLSAHSGGYGGAGGALARGGLGDAISDVLLFDAAYGYYDAFADWVKASPQHHLLSLFTDDTSTGNAALMAGVQGPQPNFYVRLADSMTLPALRTREPTFVLTTSVAHDELLQRYDWYGLFLQTTALGATGAVPELETHR